MRMCMCMCTCICISADELVLCRLCEQQVLRSSLQLHTAVCKANHRAQDEDMRATKEVRELLSLLTSTRRQALLSLLTIAVQRFQLLCAPLDKLNDLGEQLLQVVEQLLGHRHLRPRQRMHDARRHLATRRIDAHQSLSAHHARRRPGWRSRGGAEEARGARGKGHLEGRAVREAICELIDEGVGRRRRGGWR